MKHNDRNGSKQKKVGAGPNRPSKPNGKVRAKADSDHGSKRKEKKGNGSPKSLKGAPQASAKSNAPKQAPAKAPPAESDPAVRVKHEAKLIEKAHEWADLHADPHTRGAMDKVLNGLSAADQRRVVLCGQRIAAGMSVRLVK